MGSFRGNWYERLTDISDKFFDFNNDLN